DVAVGVVFQFVTPVDQLFRRIDTGNANVFLVTRFSPGLGSKPPADDKKRRLHAILIEDIGQTWRWMIPFSAEHDIRAGTIVKCQRNELFSRIGRTLMGRRRDRRRLGSAGRGAVWIEAGLDMVGTSTSTKHAENGK